MAKDTTTERTEGNMPRRGVPRPRWSEEEDRVLFSLYPAMDEIRESLTRMGQPRSDRSIRKRAMSLGLLAKVNERWTSAENSILRATYPTGGPDGTVEALRRAGYDRTRDSVASHANGMGVRCVGGIGKWTDKELAILHEAYPSGGAETTRKALEAAGYDRTLQSVITRASLEGIKTSNARRSETAGRNILINVVVDSVLDRDILDYMKGVGNRSRYIRELVRADMRRSQNA